MDEEQGLASPLTGGIRAVRRTVSSSVFGAPQTPAQPQADPITTNLIQQNTLALNNIAGQLTNISQQVSGLNNGLVAVKENLAVSDTLERQREAAKQNREAVLAEQGLREGKESQIESRIQNALTFPVRRLAQKTQFGLSRLTNFFLILTGGWLTNTVVNLINAQADGNVDLLRELKNTLQRQLLIAAGTVVALSLGFKAILGGLGFLASSALRLGRGGLLRQPFAAIALGIASGKLILNSLGQALPSTGNQGLDIGLYATIGAGLTLFSGQIVNLIKTGFKNILPKLPGGEKFLKFMTNRFGAVGRKKVTEKVTEKVTKLAAQKGIKGIFGKLLSKGITKAFGKLGGPFVSFLLALINGEGIGTALAGTAGFFAGAAIGQALIPIPVVGALIGGILGESALKAVYKGIKSLLGIKPKEEEEVDQGEFVEPGDSNSSNNLINQTTSSGGFSLTDGFVNPSDSGNEAANNVTPVNKNVANNVVEKISNLEEGAAEIINFPIANANNAGAQAGGASESSDASSNIPNIGFNENNPFTLFSTSQYGANA